MARRRPALTARTSTPQPRWANWPDRKLLDLRFCDLRVTLQDAPVARHIATVCDELAARGLAFRPHFWLGEEWFSPDGVPGIAVPFYLAHPRLARLQRRMTGEVEGGSQRACLRFLRHEVGHAIDHAYLLHRRARRQALFGKSSQAYPRSYRPRPSAREYVQHLDFWYAQSHPDEDFAETFAVWLTSRAAWRARYAGWPALRKLEYVNELMQELASERPINTSRRRVDPLSSIRKTLRAHYQEKRAGRVIQPATVYDAQLRELFASPAAGARCESAAVFLRRVRGPICRTVQQRTGQTRYTVDQIIREMIARCHELQLHRSASERRVVARLADTLAERMIHYLQRHPRRVGM